MWVRLKGGQNSKVQSLHIALVESPWRIVLKASCSVWEGRRPSGSEPEVQGLAKKSSALLLGNQRRG